MYKKIIILIICVIFISCQKNCDEEITALTAQYQKAIGYANGNSAAIIKLTADYNKRLSDLNKRCN